ncbi:hypothetical protein FRB94_012072 [Tulasnella sp. JGI-2019a]|nr:hypothetical protein FRB94_012072 [Tulasnella sp. JGI-2019a]
MTTSASLVEDPSTLASPHLSPSSVVLASRPSRMSSTVPSASPSRLSRALAYTPGQGPSTPSVNKATLPSRSLMSTRPVASLFVVAFGPIAYINLGPSGGVTFDWLLALSGLLTLFTWGSICYCHIRFRKAWAVQGHTIDEIPFQAAMGTFGSWSALFLIFLVLAAQFYTALFPVEGKGNVQDFFKSYLGLPIVIIMYVAGYL